MSYRGPGLKENKKRKSRRLCWELWLKAKAGADAQCTGPLFSKSQEGGGVVLCGRVFVWRGRGLTKLRRCGRNKEPVWSLELVSQASRGRDLTGGVSEEAGLKGAGQAASQAASVCGAPVSRRSLLPARLVVGGSGPPPRLGPKRGLWPAPRASSPSCRPYGRHQGPARMVPAAVRGLPGREHHQHDHLVPGRPGLLRYLAPTPA